MTSPNLPRSATIAHAYPAHHWAVVLAGGDGVRVRELTRFITGDERPKQFCPLLAEETLLEQARQRAERSINSEQILYSLAKSHEPYYKTDSAIRPGQRVVQPRNRGTAPAIITTLLEIERRDPDAIVAAFPCDHYYSSEESFTATLESAFQIAEAQPTSVVLLGAEPDGPETELGWLEMHEEPNEPTGPGRRLKGFHEKPPLAAAQILFQVGALWNTFVMVGHVQAFLSIAGVHVPDLLKVLRLLPPGTAEQGIEIPEFFYETIAPTDFSRHVLSPAAAQLITLSLGRLDWNDLGSASRVMATLRSGRLKQPEWVGRWRARKNDARKSLAASAVA